MNLSPSPSTCAAVTCLAAVLILALCEWVWHTAHHDKKGHR